MRSLCAVLDVEQLGRVLDDRPQQVRFVVAELALQDGRDPLQAHAGIDRRPRQRRQNALGRSRSNCMKTRFQISTKRPPPSSGNCSCSRPGSAAAGPKS